MKISTDCQHVTMLIIIKWALVSSLLECGECNDKKEKNIQKTIHMLEPCSLSMGTLVYSPFECSECDECTECND